MIRLEGAINQYISAVCYSNGYWVVGNGTTGKVNPIIMIHLGFLGLVQISIHLQISIYIMHVQENIILTLIIVVSHLLQQLYQNKE